MNSPIDDLLYANGLDAASGGYLVPPLSPDELARLALGGRLSADELTELRWRGRREEAHLGVKEGVDATDIAQAGWGVIFAAGADPAVREALGELLAHRRRQAEALAPRYREYSGPDGVRPGDTKGTFLARQGMGPGPADPDKVPYYLLLVGDPETIPYAFQSQLDVAYAVGRIHFETRDEYAAYAHSVVRAETVDPAPARRATFLGVRNPDDRSTELSATHLVAPLAEAMRTARPDWAIESILADDATKARLAPILGGDETPTLLFTASHGIGYASDDPRQRAGQGALVCSDWPGPQVAAGRPITPDWCFAASDVTADARLSGLVAFHFACFGAGTPAFDEFAHLSQGAHERLRIAPEAFVAALPQRLLGHPEGGALAFIGHVERAWGTSFAWDGAGDQLTVFQSALERIIDGQPVGHALDFFNARYAELSVILNQEREDVGHGKRVDPLDLSYIWTATNDARGYTLLGDPAVRLRVGT